MTGTAEQTLLVTDGPKQGALLRLGLFWIVSSSGPPRALLLRAWLDGRNTHQLFTLMAEHWQENTPGQWVLHGQVFDTLPGGDPSESLGLYVVRYNAWSGQGFGRPTSPAPHLV